jgi:hypothetical protein
MKEVAARLPGNSPSQRASQGTSPDSGGVALESSPPENRTPETVEYGRVGGWSFNYMLDPGSWLGRREKRPGKLTYDDLEDLLTEPQIAQGMALAKMPILAMNFKVRCKDKEIKKNLEEAIGRIWYTLSSQSLTALDYGYSAQEKRWEQDSKGAWWWTDFLPITVRQCWIKRYKNSFDGFTQGRSDAPPGSGLVVKIPVEKSFVFTNDKAEVFGNLYGRPRTYGAYLPAWMKKHIRRFCAVYYEQSAQPMKQGRAPTRALAYNPETNGTTPIDGQKWLYDNVIEKLVAGNTGYTLPSDRDERGNYLWDIVQQELANKTGADWIEFLGYLDVQITRGILLPDLAIAQTRNDAGSRAMSESHGEMFWMMQAGLLSNLRSHINLYLIPQWLYFNYGITDPYFATWEYEPLAPKTMTWLQEIVNRQVQAGTLEVNVDELSDRMGIGMERVTPPSPGMGGAGGKDLPIDGTRQSSRNAAEQARLELEYLEKFPKGQMFLVGV